MVVSGLLLGDGVVGRVLVLVQWLDAPHHAALRIERDHADLWLAHEHAGCEAAPSRPAAPEGQPGPGRAAAGRDAIDPSGHLVHLCQEGRDTGPPGHLHPAPPAPARASLDAQAVVVRAAGALRPRSAPTRPPRLERPSLLQV